MNTKSLECMQPETHYRYGERRPLETMLTQLNIAHIFTERLWRSIHFNIIHRFFLKYICNDIIKTGPKNIVISKIGFLRMWKK